MFQQQSFHKISIRNRSRPAIRCYLIGCVLIVLCWYCGLHPTATLASSTTSSQDPGLVTQEIRYQIRDAGKVFLVWGINNWTATPEAMRPVGTVLKDALMYTPMVRSGASFVAKVQVPAGATVDYIFQITEAPNGSLIDVWDSGGIPEKDYHTIADKDKVVVIEAQPAIIEQVVQAQARSSVPWYAFLLSIGVAVVGLGALGRYIIRRRVLQADRLVQLGQMPASATNEVRVSRLTIGTARKILTHSALFSLLVAIICAIVVIYVSNEHTIYYWDDAVYHDMTLEQAIYFRDLPKHSLGQLRHALNDIRESTGNDYSSLHTLLIIPFVLTFGDSRLVYILTIALVYLLPFILISGAVASKIIAYRPTVVFWSTAFFMLCIPAVWSPTLHGYPDTGSAALIALAILSYLYDLRLKHWWQILLIGFCIALAILFRRHFIYDGITFFAAISIQALITFGLQLRQDIRAALQNLCVIGLRIALVAAATVIALAVLGWPFIDRVLHTNFGLLYASYEVPFEENALYYISQYGWLACSFTAIGFTAALLKHSPVRQHVGFIALFFGISWMQWMISVRQLGFHYTLHFTLYIVLGILTCVSIVWSDLRNWKRLFALVCMGVFIAINALVGLSRIELPSDALVVSDRFNLSLSGLFAANDQPLARKDYNEIVRLVDYLRSISSPADPIYVAASSGTINDDILWHAERTLYENVMDSQVDTFWENKGLNILHWIPFADSRDYYPLEKLLLSQYVVIATPFQYHLHPDEQKVVNVVVDAFEKDWELSHDFVRLPEQFSLEHQVTVRVYKRIRPTSLATALHTLKAMRDYIGIQPGEQSSWMALSETPGYYISKNRDDMYDIAIDLEQLKAPVTSFLYIDNLPNQAVIAGEMSNSNTECGNPSLQVTAIDGDGRKVNSATFQGSAADTSEFSLSLRTQTSAYLLLDVAEASNAGQPRSSCWLSLHNLAITNK